MKKDYVVLNLAKEYPGYTGSEKWMVITDHGMDQLERLFPELKPFLSSAVIIGTDIGKAIIGYKNNDRKHDRHMECVGLQIEVLKCRAVPQRDKSFKNNWLKKAVLELPDAQRRRVLLFYCDGYSEEEIANIEKVSKQAVSESIQRGINNLKRNATVVRGTADV